MAFSTKPYKGTRDFFPEDMVIQNWMFDNLSQVVERYGYFPYNGPMVEPFELYAAKSGEEIVSNQLYHFEDRAQRKVAIRPEMTPTLARMVAGRLQELPRPVRLYSIPNFWRYERPQRGRLREFWQLNVDILGGEDTFADAEILKIAYDIVNHFEGASKVTLHINNRKLINHVLNEKLGLSAEAGLAASKAIDEKDKVKPEDYEQKLADAGLSADQVQQLEHFFNTSLADLGASYPCEGTNELVALFELLQSHPCAAHLQFNPKIMRGLDYYTGMVFEVFDHSPENNRAMFGGGRYDNLIGLFGKQQLSGVGFGMGDVTLKNFLETHKLIPEGIKPTVDVFVATDSEAALIHSQNICDTLRDHGLKVSQSLSKAKFGNQLKVANKVGARWALLLGQNEIEQNVLTLKDLAKGEQKSVPLNEALQMLQSER